MSEDIIINVPLDDFSTTDFNPITEVSLEGTNEDTDSVKEEEAIEEKEDFTAEKEEPVKEEVQENFTINLEEKVEEFLGSDYVVTVLDDDGNSVDISAKDYVTDFDLLLDVIKSKHDKDIEDIKSNSINTENLDKIQKDIVQIVTKGGNPLELITLQKDYLQPLSEIDLETEDGQIEVIAIDLRDKGNSEDTIEILLEGYKAKGILEDKAISAKEFLDNKYKSKIEEVAKKEEERLVEIEKARKQYTKDIGKELESLGYNEKAIRDLKKFATDVKPMGENSTARMTEMDAAYLELRNNPSTAVELILYLNNREEFKKAITKKEVSKQHIETSKKIITVKKRHSSGSGSQNNSRSNKDGANDVLAVVPL